MRASLTSFPSVTIGILSAPLIPIRFNLSYGVQIIQNVLYIPAFALLSIVLLQLFRNFRLSVWLWLPCSLIVLLLIGVGGEVVQTFVPGRWPSYSDIQRNLVGISFGVFLFLLVEKLKPDLIRRIVCK